MELRIGPPATGANFFKRPPLIAKLMRALRRGNVAFLGPRRTGKTSCLEEIKAHPDGFVPIMLNLEKHDSVEAWLAEMLTELSIALEQPGSKKWWPAGRIGEFLARIRKIKVGPAEVELEARRAQFAWRKPADEFLALLVESDLPVLFLLDEFPTFLKLVAKKSSSSDEVEAVLNWFRASRHDLKDRKTRFLVTGSIGLKGVVRRLGLAHTVNEFDTHDIPPLTDEEAIGLLENLAADNQVPFRRSAAQHILSLLGANWPLLLQMFIAELQDARFDQAPTRRQLENIYRERLVAGVRNQYCDGMYDRLKDAFSDSECRLAREILRTAARSTEGLGRKEFEAIHAALVPHEDHRKLVSDELDYVLDTLKHDGYLLQRADGPQFTCFASNILRDFWLRKTA